MNIERIKSALAKGGAHLGDMVFWHLGDARVARETLEKIWLSTGLDPDLLPDPPTVEKALKASVREAQTGQRERLIRLGKESEAEIVFAIVHESRLPDGGLSYLQEARVHLDRNTEILTSDHPGHDLVHVIRDGFDVLRTTHTLDDVRRSVVKALRTFGSVALRDGGGVYFVPSPFADSVRRLQAAIEQIGSSRVYILPVHKSEEAQRTLGEISKASLEEELAALKLEIAAFTQVPPERASTLMRRFDAFEALRARAQLYRSVLNVEVQDLDHQLNQLSSTVEQLLTHKNAA